MLLLAVLSVVLDHCFKVGIWLLGSRNQLRRFLAGIGGGQNSNAPKASDVSEALAYIRQNNHGNGALRSQ